jgi:alkyldihydroxyacetonephosphate synthase
MTTTPTPPAPEAFPIPIGPGAPSFLVNFTEPYEDIETKELAPVVPVTDEVLARLEAACADVSTDHAVRVEAGRDWWPLGFHWIRAGEVGGLAGVVVRPTTVEEVSAVLAVCNEARVPVTAAGGRSGCVGGSIPVFGGVALDMTAIIGITEVDAESLTVDVRTGTFGDLFEQELRAEHGLTLGHWPQSISLSTVGGWLACRGAGQLSNKYGKIEDMVVGLDVVLADGTLITTGGAARSASGPDLNQLFVGSEGTLGVMVGAKLRLHPAPTHERRAAVAFDSFEEGLDACRRMLRRGIAPAVLRLYDAIESNWKFKTGDELHLLLALDEGDEHTVEASFAVFADECAGAKVMDDALVEVWLEERNDVSSIPKALENGVVYDTIEVTGPWSKLPAIYRQTIEAMVGVEHTFGASSHQSHAYREGACLYFTFAGLPPAEAKEKYYNDSWAAASRAILAAGGNLSHHHGVGLNRARFMREALGPAFDSLVAIKHALDPNGILNPGKLGLPSPFGEVAFP